MTPWKSSLWDQYYSFTQNDIQEMVRIVGWITDECLLKAPVPGVSMRPPPCADADDLLSCSVTVGNLGERGEPDIFT